MGSNIMSCLPDPGVQSLLVCSTMIRRVFVFQENSYVQLSCSSHLDQFVDVIVKICHLYQEYHWQNLILAFYVSGLMLCFFHCILNEVKHFYNKINMSAQQFMCKHKLFGCIFYMHDYITKQMHMFHICHYNPKQMWLVHRSE